MACNKVKYKNKKEAQSVLNNLFMNGNWNKKELDGRIYECEECNAWHITSSPFRKAVVDVGSKKLKFVKKWNKLLKKNK